MRKYQPTTAPTLTKVHKLFYQAKLQKEADPDAFITHLESLRTRMEEMGSAITDDQFMMHVLGNLTSDYENQVERLEERIGNLKNALTIEDMRESLCLRYERLKDREENESSDNEEHAMAAGKFKGKCNHCGMWGHTASTCRNRKNGGNGKGEGKQYPKSNPNSSPGKKNRPELICWKCGEKGHRKSDCPKKEQEYQHANAHVEKVAEKEVCLGCSEVQLETLEAGSWKGEQKEVAQLMTQKISKNIWLADSGASMHMGPDETGLTNVRTTDSSIKIGNGTYVKATKIGDKHVTLKQEDGTRIDIVLKDYMVVPELWACLFAVTKALKGDWNLGNQGTTMFLEKDGCMIKFDKKFGTGSGILCGCELIPRIPEMKAHEQSLITLDEGKVMDINVLHKLLGHPSEDIKKNRKVLWYQSEWKL